MNKRIIVVDLLLKELDNVAFNGNEIGMERLVCFYDLCKIIKKLSTPAPVAQDGDGGDS